MASVISSPGSEYSESSVFSYGSIESAITDISITSPTDGPKSLKSQDAASKLFSAVDFQLNSIPPSAEKFDLDISYREVRWELKLSAKERLLIFPYAEPFIDQLSSKSRNSSKSSTPALAASFLQYLCGQEDSIEATQIVLHAFEKQFLPGTDIHSLAHGLDQSSQTVLLKGYYAALRKTSSTVAPSESALFEASCNGYANIYAIFGGQGAVNPLCLRELTALYSIYGVCLEELADIATTALQNLSSSPRASKFYDNVGFDVKKWLTDPSTAPPLNLIISAPLSLPIIGLVSFAHYTITCKVTGQTPGQMRACIHGVTGHSQGIIVAAAIASSSSWAEFHNSVAQAMEMLFWIGFESHFLAPAEPLSTAEIKDAVKAGEGRPSPMLAVRDIKRDVLELLIEKTNRRVSEKDRIYMALVNAPDNMVVSGPPKSLRLLSFKLRKLTAQAHDHSRVVQYRYLPITAPFHSPHLEAAEKRVLHTLSSSSIFASKRLETGVFHTNTGKDLRDEEPSKLTKALVGMVMTEAVDWTKASHFSDATHVLDFGPGRIGLLQQHLVGNQAEVIIASDLRAVSEEVSSKEVLFSSALPASWKAAIPSYDKASNSNPPSTPEPSTAEEDDPLDNSLPILTLSGTRVRVLPTRAAQLWHHLDSTLFSLPSPSQAAHLQTHRHDILARLATDYHKPWFSIDFVGTTIDPPQMTYLEVLHRLITLLYNLHTSRWAAPSCPILILTFATRSRESLFMLSPFPDTLGLDDPFAFLAAFAAAYPGAEDEVLSPRDVDFFVELCRRYGDAVRFIPCLDGEFERWFKLDSIVQARDVEGLEEEEMQRLCVARGTLVSGFRSQND